MTFTCAVCGKTHVIKPTEEMDRRFGCSMVKVPGWTSHAFVNQTGRIDKTVSIYTCSDACREKGFSPRADPDDYPETLKEALVWLESKKEGE